MKVLFATGNEGKFNEVREMLAPLGFQVERLDDEYPELQADGLEEVVTWGLDWLWQRHHTPIMIDDSGLFIDALGGFPGVYSAYVFKTLGCEGVLKLLEGKENRKAEFRCCAGYIEDGENVIVSGVVEGEIITEMLGSSGFGYDPIFVPSGESRTFAEMVIGEKNEHSHRSRAFKMLAEKLETGER